MVTLRDLDISYAHPWTALVYVLVVASGVVIFGESIGWPQIAGLGLICLGVFIAARFSI